MLGAMLAFAGGGSAAAVAGETNVLVMEVTGGGSVGDMDDELESFYDAQPGISASIHPMASGDLEASDLADIDLLITAAQSALSSSEHSLLAALLARGGRVLFITDNPVAMSPFNVNTALAALGSTVIVTNTTVSDNDCGASVKCLANVTGGALTTGVTNFWYVAVAEVSGGTVLLSTKQANAPFIVTENLAAGSVVVSGDTNITNDLLLANDNDVFFLNLADVDANPVAVPALQPGARLLLLALMIVMTARSRTLRTAER
jgi:hypothetical protein